MKRGPDVQPGDLLELITPGGGFGLPASATPPRVARDHELGYVTTPDHLTKGP